MIYPPHHGRLRPREHLEAVRSPFVGHPFAFSDIHTGLEALRGGRLIIVVDDDDRENEGDLMIAADKATPDAVNFMVTHGRGLVCLAMTPERLEELDIPLMVSANTAAFDTAFCVSIDARERTTTGISAADRAATIRAASDPRTRPSGLSRPGHVFPLRARQGGVLTRAGHTEAAVDLARIAGLFPAGVICEVMNTDGSMARIPELLRFGSKHQLPVVTIADLIEYRVRTESLFARIASADLPTAFGKFKVHAFESLINRREHVVLTYGDIAGGTDVLAHVHAQCVAGDVFRHGGCNCAPRLDDAMRGVASAGRGAVLYLSRGDAAIGDQLRAYAAGDAPNNSAGTPRASQCAPDLGEYGDGAQLLRQLGVRSVRLLSDDPVAATALETYGMSVIEQLPTATANSVSRETDWRCRPAGTRAGAPASSTEHVTLDTRSASFFLNSRFARPI